MSRGERRYHTRRVRAKKFMILYSSFGPYGRERLMEKRHQALNEIGNWLMSSCPKAWRKQMMIRPARAQAKHMLRIGEYECLPDYRKPHIYYW